MIGHIYCSRFDNTTSNDNVSMIKLIRFAIPVTIFAILTSSLLNVDLLLVKGILNENIYAGFYTAARSLATTPFFLSIALSRSMFPSIAKSVSENNPEVTRQYIHQGLRLLLLWIVPLVVIVSSTSYALVEFIYSVEYIPAGEPLSILIIGLGFFTVYLILTTIITAGGRPVIAMWINVIALCMDVGLNLYLIPRYDIKGAAIGTSTAMFTGVIIAGGYVLYRFKALISLMCVIRIILGVIPVWLITILTHVKGCWLIPWYIFLFGIYIVTLSLLQEIKGKELFHIREIISEHKQKKG
jgi:O-antigen/teichoic acid export membrane protein